jgi:hypothetical protein
MSYGQADSPAGKGRDVMRDSLDMEGGMRTGGVVSNPWGSPGGGGFGGSSAGARTLTGLGASVGTGMVPKEAARAREVEQQIAYLRWKRMQNDREIKKAITVSRALKKKDAVLNYSTDKSTERFMWANSVVRDELQRPLVISDAELHYLQHEEVKAKKKLEKVRLL